MSVRDGSGVVALSSVRASFSTCAFFLEEEDAFKPRSALFPDALAGSRRIQTFNEIRDILEV